MLQLIHHELSRFPGKRRERDRVFRGKRGMTKIKGLVVPQSWDEKGDILEIAVDTPDEKRYQIVLDETGRYLMPFVRTVVEVTGRVHRDRLGRLAISVESFESESQAGSGKGSC